MQDKKAYFDEVYETYVKQIFRFVFLRVNNTQTAEDITSETFLRFWRKIEQGKYIDNERALLYVIARGIIIDYYRSKKNIREVKFEEVADDKQFTNDEIIEKIYLNEKISKIYKRLETIKKEYREIILLRFVEDLEYAEIATVLGKKEVAIRVLLHRAIATLKGIL